MVATAERKRKKPKAGEALKLDLACGQNKTPGFLGVDIVGAPGVDVVFDLRQTPWPWKDGEVAEVVCSHFLEHLTGEERIAFMDELWRVLAEGGKATIITPYYTSMRAVQDPTHKWPPVCEASYLYFNKGWREQNRLDHYPIRCDFDFSYGYLLAGDVAARAQEFRDYAIRSLNNSVNDLQVVLTKKA